MTYKEKNMSDNTANLTVGGDAKDYAIMDGTVGPQVIDVRKLYANTGMFTYDPGFTSTASLNRASPISTATRASCSTVVIRSASSPKNPASWKSATCC